MQELWEDICFKFDKADPEEFKEMVVRAVVKGV